MVGFDWSVSFDWVGFALVDWLIGRSVDLIGLLRLVGLVDWFHLIGSVRFYLIGSLRLVGLIDRFYLIGLLRLVGW